MQVPPACTQWATAAHFPGRGQSDILLLLLLYIAMRRPGRGCHQPVCSSRVDVHTWTGYLLKTDLHANLTALAKINKCANACHMKTCTRLFRVYTVLVQVTPSTPFREKGNEMHMSHCAVPPSSLCSKQSACLPNPHSLTPYPTTHRPPCSNLNMQQTSTSFTQHSCCMPHTGSHQWENPTSFTLQ